MDGWVGDKSTDVRSSLPSSDSRVLVPVSLPNDESNRFPPTFGGGGKACLSSVDRWCERFTTFAIGFGGDGTGGRGFLAVGELFVNPNLGFREQQNTNVNEKMTIFFLFQWYEEIRNYRMYAHRKNVPWFQFSKAFLIFGSIDKHLQLLVQGLCRWLGITSIRMNV